MARQNAEPVAYLNYEAQSTKLIVYNNPLVTADSCAPVDARAKKKICKEAVGQLSHNAKVKITGPAVPGQTIDPFSGDTIDELFVPVMFANKKGFIAKSLLSAKRLQPFFVTTKHTAKNSRGIASLETDLNFFKKHDAVEAAQSIYGLVGECVIPSVSEKKTNLSNRNIFDDLVLSKIKAKPVPFILTSHSKKPISKDDVINIDALARTIYGEMGKCFRKGLQYPIAAARVAVNRLESKSRFREWTSTSIKRNVASLPALAHIITTPEKFNNWKQTSSGLIEGPLQQSLCPPKFVNKPFWKESKASQAQVDIWKNAVRIATEAVLFRDKFKARAPAMKNINFYTSGLGEYKGYTQVFPVINGRALDNDQCIETWKEPVVN